jgi:DNA polymerase IV (archaeal DinB-like DNA polymerase)
LSRVVGHLDLDYFYAQVEEIENPSLKGLPVLVCVYSGRTEDSGVVSTANYAARKLGIRSGIPIALAKKRLGDAKAALIPMRHEKYESYSERIMSVLKENSDIIEQTGIDEAFFDVTARAAGDFELAREMALRIKQEILQSERLTCSIGLAPNKVVAKLASDFKKPDGLTVVLPQEAKGFMAPLPIEKLYGVGPKSAGLLKGEGITTIGALADASPMSLEQLFGRKSAVYLLSAANGVDNEPVVERGSATQLSRIITLKRDSRDAGDILSQLAPAINDLHRKVTEKKLFFRSISVIGILTDLSIRTKSKTIEAPTDQLSVMNENVPELLAQLVTEHGTLRRVGVKVTDLTEGKQQSSLAEFLR